MRFRSRSILAFVFVISLSVIACYAEYRAYAQQTNRPPIAAPDSVTVHGSAVTPAGANALANDSDPDGDSLTVTYATRTYTPFGSGVVDYLGGINASGGRDPGSFTVPYTVTDNRGGSASSYVTVNVINSAPTPSFDIVVVSGTNNYASPVNVLANDSDPDGDGLHLGYQTWLNLPGGAGQYVVYTNGDAVVARNPSFSGTVVVFYQVYDSLGASSAGAIVVVLLPMDLANNAGSFCPSVGYPVNPTNGNMWIDQPPDYVLPGVGDAVEVRRFYNSVIQTSGLFGHGWATQYDESLSAYGDKMLRLNMPDGRAVYFVRQNATDPFVAYQSEVQGQIIQNPDGTFTLAFKDGRIHEFSSAGKLTRQEDRNGNETVLAYDGSGFLTTVTDPFGRSLTLTPNTSGQVGSISDSLGTAATYEYYTGTSRLKTVTYPDGSKHKFEYDTTSASGKVLLKTVKDAYDNVLETHLYDSAGRATTSERHGGVEKYEFDYTNAASSNPYTIVKHKKNAADPYITTKYYFNNKRGRNSVTKTEGACGCGAGGSETTEFQYDADLKLKRTIDAEGRITDFTYDANRNVTQVTDPLGVRKWTYNARGQVLTYKDRVDQSTGNNTVENAYDANGNLLTTNDALGHTTAFTYTTIGQPETVKDARNKITTFGYDTQGRLEDVTDANSKVTTFGYDVRARVTSITNARSETTTFEYDPHNRLKKVTLPDSNYIEHTYDLAGRLTATRDPRGHSTVYGYDNAYRLTSLTDPLSHSVAFGYDLMSNLTSRTDALGNVTNFEYDDFHRLIKTIHPPATVGATRLEESVTYDKVGNVKTRVDTAGRTTSYLYDASNRLTKITDALLNATQFEYDLRSNRTKVKDALDQEYIFAYDPLGRVLSETRAGTTRSYRYDAVGNRIKRTDHNGTVTDYVYDDLNRLTTKSYGGVVDSTFTYDELSRLLTATNGAGTVTFAYDNRGRLASETDVHGRLIEYGYDAAGNRTSLELDGHPHTAYAYDPANRLTTLTDDASQTYTYGYDIADRLTSKALPNGITTTYDYDGLSRLSRMKDAATGSTIFDRQYAYNAASQIASITEPSRTRTFGYDAIDRLTSVTDSVLGSETYAYDAVGNRTASPWSSTYTHQPFNRLTATATAAYGQDANGNTSSKSEGLINWTYTFDPENRLTQAAAGSVSIQYAYDALGRRVRRTDAAGTTEFALDGGDVILDDSTATGLSVYHNGPGIDEKLSVRAGTATNYFLADHLGTADALTDNAGSITSTAAYDAFGNATGNLATRYAYTGREQETLTGLMYYRARFYDPKLGRFISEDPIGFAGGDINLYGYVRNNPIRFTDPSGEFPKMFPNVLIGRFTPISFDEFRIYLATGGMVPGAGEFCDLADGGISLYEGDYVDAGLSGAAAMPFAGWGAGLTKVYKRFDDFINLRRPYLRKPTRNAVIDGAPRGPKGEWIDANTGESFTEKPHFGHKYGMEFWRMRDEATRNGLTQKQFNDWMNDPDLYQIERPINNWSHKFEKPRDLP